MRLNELLKADSIVIQCHNNPDADALASGYGIYAYSSPTGKKMSGWSTAERNASGEAIWC